MTLPKTDRSRPHRRARRAERRPHRLAPGCRRRLPGEPDVLGLHRLQLVPRRRVHRRRDVELRAGRLRRAVLRLVRPRARRARGRGRGDRRGGACRAAGAGRGHAADPVHLRRPSGRRRMVGLPARRLRHLALGGRRARRAARHWMPRAGRAAIELSVDYLVLFVAPPVLRLVGGARQARARLDPRMHRGRPPRGGRPRRARRRARGIRRRGRSRDRGADAHRRRRRRAPRRSGSARPRSTRASPRSSASSTSCRETPNCGRGDDRRGRGRPHRRRRRAPLPRRHLLRRRPMAAALLHARPRPRSRRATSSVRANCSTGRHRPPQPTGRCPNRSAATCSRPSGSTSGWSAGDRWHSRCSGATPC